MALTKEKEKPKFDFKSLLTNLKPGMGEPWAGHNMARLVDSISVNLEKSDF